MITNYYDEVTARHLDDVLEDDGTPYGGTSFKGETLRDFIDENLEDIRYDYGSTDLTGINRALKACGIKPVQDIILTTDDIREMDDDTFNQLLDAVKDEEFRRYKKRTAKIDLDDGHTLVAEASYGDCPQIEVSIDGDVEKMAYATELHDDDPDRPVLRTYVYYENDDEVRDAFDQDYGRLIRHLTASEWNSELEQIADSREVVAIDGSGVRFHAYCELDDGQRAYEDEKVFSLYANGGPVLEWADFNDIVMIMDKVSKDADAAMA